MAGIQYTVKCPCGAGVTLEARAFGRSQPCKACKGSIVVAWGRDKMNTQTIPVVVRHVPGPGQPARPLTPQGPEMKTQIVPQARFFDCVCGARNVLMGKGAGAKISCSGCDRVHVLEEKEDGRRSEAADSAPPRPGTAAGPAPKTTKAPPPKPAAAPPSTRKAAAPAPPPPPAPARTPKLGEILCKCGEIMPPRTSKTGREFECKACGRKGHVVPGQDAKGLPKIDTVFTHEPAPKKPPPPAAVAACPCGAELAASVELAGQVVACDACGRELEVVAKNGFVRLRERATP